MKTATKFLFLCFLLFSGSLSAKPYEVGQTVAPFEAKDQHDKPYKLDSKTRFLLLTSDMSTGKMANKALDKKGGAYLSQKKAVYVANIFGMPGIGRFFAFKKMKKYSHRIIYADSENFMTPFPVQQNKVTVLKLNDKGEVLNVSFWNPATEGVDAYLK